MRADRRHRFRWQQWLPLAPDVGIAFVHDSNGVDADGDLPPVCPVRNGEARHRAGATGGQVDDAARKFRRRDASSDRRCDVGKSCRLDLFTRTDPLETARLKFAHNIFLSKKRRAGANTGTPLVQMLCVTATTGTFLFSHTRTQLAAVANSALVGFAPATLALVNFTPRG